MNPVSACLFALGAFTACANALGEHDGAHAMRLARRDDGTQHKSDDSLSTTSDDSKHSATDSAAPTSSTISIDPALPAGGVNLETPAATSTTYIKSGEKVTFGWNYTSLSITPSAINIEVSCSQNSQVYTLASNQSVETSSIVWDTDQAAKDGGLHLISAEYTLSIYDAATSPSDVATAGKLAPFTFTFGVYIPQKYTPWPQGAKYVNLSIRLGPPAFLTSFATLFTAVIAMLM